jgi:hypothetical protein
MYVASPMHTLTPLVRLAEHGMLRTWRTATPRIRVPELQSSETIAYNTYTQFCAVLGVVPLPRLLWQDITH